MKEFDLELAKAGHPVQTRDGKKARILCFDRKDDDCPIVALVEIDEYEYTKHYTLKGVANDINHGMDLFMAPYKHEGWVNVYRDADTGLPYCGNFIYPSESNAVTHNDPDDRSDKKVSVTKIEWEE